MRFASACLIALLVGCGGCGAPKPPPPVYDDLELEPAMRARDPQRHRDGGAATEPASDAGEPSARVEVVEEPATGGGAPRGDKRIDLAVRDADVGDVLRMIAVAAGVDLVVSDDVNGTVTLEVRHVTWRQAIDVIAHLEGLTVTDQDGIVMVTRAPR